MDLEKQLEEMRKTVKATRNICGAMALLVVFLMVCTAAMGVMVFNKVQPTVEKVQTVVTNVDLQKLSQDVGEINATMKKVDWETLQEQLKGLDVEAMNETLQNLDTEALGEAINNMNEAADTLRKWRLF